MATITLNCDSSNNNSFRENAKINLIYSCLNGRLEITSIESVYSGNDDIYDENIKEIYIEINGQRKTFLLDNYINFSANTNVTWYEASQSDHFFTWGNLVGDTKKISIIMPESPAASGAIFNNAVFTGVIQMSWDEYIISYDVNGGENTPPQQTKRYNSTITLSDIKPIRTGFKFVRWVSELSDGTILYYQPSDTTGYHNENQILIAEWMELTDIKNKVITSETLGSLHDYNRKTYETKENVETLINGITLTNLFANENAVLSSNQYGDELPEAGTVGRIFFKRLTDV